ncbi:MAG: hypothetical protein ACLQHS_00945, partial [Candidatus Limnocylindrales bacterium]
ATPAQLVRAAMRGSDGSVLLTHGGPALTPLILPTVISQYRDLGFRFVTVPELLGWTAPAVVAPNPVASVGLRAL